MDALCALLDCALGFFPCYFLFGCNQFTRNYATPNPVFAYWAQHCHSLTPCSDKCRGGRGLSDSLPSLWQRGHKWKLWHRLHVPLVLPQVQAAARVLSEKFLEAREALQSLSLRIHLPLKKRLDSDQVLQQSRLLGVIARGHDADILATPLHHALCHLKLSNRFAHGGSIAHRMRLSSVGW